MAEDVRVAIAPAHGQTGIPMDVATTLMNVVGLAYPNARMGQQPGAAFVLIVDDEDRAPRTTVGKRAANKAFQPRMDPMDDETRLIGFDGKDLRVAAPAVVGLHLCQLGMLMLNGMEGASNYVEIPASNPETGDRVLVTVQRPEGQTPHALRQRAEGERDALAHQLARVSEHVDKNGSITPSELRRLLNEG